jgi:hypothetical protein
MMIYDYAGGRKFSPPERLLFSTATYDQRMSAVMEAFGTRNMGPLEMMMRGIPLALRARARRSLSRRGRTRSDSAAVPTAAASTAARESSTRAIR